VKAPQVLSTASTVANLHGAGDVLDCTGMPCHWGCRGGHYDARHAANKELKDQFLKDLPGTTIQHSFRMDRKRTFPRDVLAASEVGND